jgi:hypothetical protein
MDKQQERLGSRKKHPPRDNLDLDVMDALAQGYGCQYGRFKADHPFTKDANEARLAPKPKTKPAKEKPAKKKPPRPRLRKYTIVCKCCGNQFVSTSKGRVYCSPACKFNRGKKEVTP